MRALRARVGAAQDRGDPARLPVVQVALLEQAETRAVNYCFVSEMPPLAATVQLNAAYVPVINDPFTVTVTL